MLTRCVRPFNLDRPNCFLPLAAKKNYIHFSVFPSGIIQLYAAVKPLRKYCGLGKVRNFRVLCRQGREQCCAHRWISKIDLEIVCSAKPLGIMPYAMDDFNKEGRLKIIYVSFYGILCNSGVYGKLSK